MCKVHDDYNNKKSMFNITYKIDNSHIIYNTFSGAIISLNKENFMKYNSQIGDENFTNNMYDGGFYVQENIDEVEFLKNLSDQIRSDNQGLSLTIAPTLKCNFVCPYCYEEKKSTPTMTKKVMDDVLSFIYKKLNNSSNKQLYITWYGGEPLLALNEIEYLTKSLINQGIQLKSAIVTNGYYLTEKNAQKLHELNVDYAQITIDGPPDIHNVRRCLPNKEDTFFRIMENISSACKYIDINVRINIDKKNMERVDELLDYLDKYNLKNKIGVYLAPVDNINDTYKDNVCLKNIEFSDIEMNFYLRNYKRGYTFVHLPCVNANICGAVNNNTFVIDPLGDLYKCWDEVGNKNKSYGDIYGYINQEIKNFWEDYDFIYFEDCKKCQFLPICMGGCPYNNKISGNMKCNSLKYNHNKLIELKRKIFMEEASK